MTDVELRTAMVERVRATAATVSDEVLAALLAVPRHHFLVDLPLETVYQDEAIVTKRGPGGIPISSSSQPTIMAIMLDQLSVRPGDRILEIGAGTGYNAALLATLAGPDGRVVSVDIDADIAERAQSALSDTAVTVVCGDGAFGYPDGAPYDRIIATVGAWDLLPEWTLQLAPGGRIVFPLDLGGAQCSVAFEYADGAWVSRSVVLCGFMRMRGTEAGPESHAPVDADLQVMLPTGGTVPVDVADWLTSAAPVGRVDVDHEFPLWLGIYSGDLCMLASSAPDERLGDALFTYGILGADGIAFLGKSVMAGGPSGPALASLLMAQAEAWHAHGRPSAADLSIMALPLSAPFSGIALEKRHTRLLLSWGTRAR